MNVFLTSLLGICLLWSASTAEAAPTRYGKELLGVYDLPEELISKMNGGGKPVGQAKPGESAIVSALLADSRGEWAGDEFRAPQKGNPYVIVIHAKVTAVADGDTNSLWETGWVINDATRVSLAPGFTKGSKAGAAGEFTVVSQPISVKEDRAMRPKIALKSSSNMKFDSVKVEVWSGLGGGSWLQRFWAFIPAFIGVVMLAWFVWSRRS